MNKDIPFYKTITFYFFPHSTQTHIQAMLDIYILDLYYNEHLRKGTNSRPSKKNLFDEFKRILTASKGQLYVLHSQSNPCIVIAPSPLRLDYKISYYIYYFPFISG